MEHHEKQYNSTLYHEDVERLIQYGATDIVDLNNPAGYEDNNGWGRLNAGKSIDLISDGKKVVHFKVNPGVQSLCNDSIPCFISLTRFYDSSYETTQPDNMFHDSTLMLGQVRKHSVNINLDICALGAKIHVLDSTLDKYSAWEVNSRSNLWGKLIGDISGSPPDTLWVVPEDSIYWEEGPTVSNDSCVLTGKLVGHSFKITTIGGTPVPGEPGFELLPNNGGAPSVMHFSVLVDDPNDSLDQDIVITDIEEAAQQNHKPSVYLYPNPTRDLLTIEAHSPEMTTFRIELLDMNGRILKQMDDGGVKSKIFNAEISVSDLPRELYFLRSNFETGTTVSKFIKS